MSSAPTATENSTPLSNLESGLIALTNGKPSSADETFQPSSAHFKIAGALNETSVATQDELCTRAGVSRATLSRALNTPTVLSWIIAQSSRLVEARTGAIHARLFEKATSGNVAAMRLYLERFDPEYKKQKVMEKGGTHLHTNFITEMSDRELPLFIQRKIRQLTGGDGTPPALDIKESHDES